MLSLGQIAYETYAAARDWRTVTGSKMPEWYRQDPVLCAAWDTAANAVAEYVMDGNEYVPCDAGVHSLGVPSPDDTGR